MVRAPRVGLRSLGWLSSLVLLAALLLRCVFQSIEVWGPIEGLSLESLRTVAIESRWGMRWQWQAAAAALTALGMFTALRSPVLGGVLAWVGAFGVAAALPMTGHAYGDSLAWTAQSVHILGRRVLDRHPGCCAPCAVGLRRYLSGGVGIDKALLAALLLTPGDCRRLAARGKRCAACVPLPCRPGRRCGRSHTARSFWRRSD